MDKTKHELNADLLETETEIVQLRKRITSLRIQRNTLDSKLARAREVLSEVADCMRGNSIGWEAARKECNKAKARCDLVVRIAKRVQDERDNANALCKAARAVACRLLWERDQARDERDTFELASYAHEE